MAATKSAIVKSQLDFEPNLLAVADGCPPCAVAKELYGPEIDAGRIRVVDIEEALEIEGFYECIASKYDRAGVPILARVENNRVCKCSMGY